MPVVTPYIPEFITVHLGSPSSNAPNVTVSFPDYVKNVASSEIYPTWDEDALRAYFKGVCKAASGCLFEMAQREVLTLFGDYERGRRYVEIAKECVDRYWKP